MVRIENDCVGCATENYPCVGSLCPLRNAKHYYCDQCKEEATIYHFEDEQLCIECIEKRLERVW